MIILNKNLIEKILEVIDFFKEESISSLFFDNNKIIIQTFSKDKSFLISSSIFLNKSKEEIRFFLDENNSKEFKDILKIIIKNKKEDNLEINLQKLEKENLINLKTNNITTTLIEKNLNNQVKVPEIDYNIEIIFFKEFIEKIISYSNPKKDNLSLTLFNNQINFIVKNSYNLKIIDKNYKFEKYEDLSLYKLEIPIEILKNYFEIYKRDLILKVTKKPSKILLLSLFEEIEDKINLYYLF